MKGKQKRLLYHALYTTAIIILYIIFKLYFETKVPPKDEFLSDLALQVLLK